MLLNEKVPNQIHEFSAENCPNGILAKLQNSIQILIILWPVYPIHTNSLFWVIFEELPFCHLPRPNTSIRGKDSQISVDLSFEHISFSNKGRTTILFPSPLTFLQWPIMELVFIA